MALIDRYLISDLEFKDLTVPEGNYICAAPCVSQLDETAFPHPHKFDPSRYTGLEENGEWSLSGVDTVQKSARGYNLPFGAGRHRCIGEGFAGVQVKTIVVAMLKEFEIRLDGSFPQKDYTQLIVLPVKGSKLLLKKRV